MAEYDPHMIKVDEHGLIIKDPNRPRPELDALVGLGVILVVLVILFGGLTALRAALDSNPATRIVGTCYLGPKPQWANQQQLDNPPFGWTNCHANAK